MHACPSIVAVHVTLIDACVRGAEGNNTRPLQATCAGTEHRKDVLLLLIASHPCRGVRGRAASLSPKSRPKIPLPAQSALCLPRNLLTTAHTVRKMQKFLNGRCVPYDGQAGAAIGCSVAASVCPHRAMRHRRRLVSLFCEQFRLPTRPVYWSIRFQNIFTRVSNFLKCQLLARLLPRAGTRGCRDDRGCDGKDACCGRGAAGSTAAEGCRCAVDQVHKG